MSKLVKKFGQFTQAMGEMMGSTQKTGIYVVVVTLTTFPDTSEDFKRLQGDTKARKECIDHIENGLELIYKSLCKITGQCGRLIDNIAKEKDSIDGKEKKLISQVLAQGMSNYGGVLPNNSPYGLLYLADSVSQSQFQD